MAGIHERIRQNKRDRVDADHRRNVEMELDRIERAVTQVSEVYIAETMRPSR